jgi:peptidoglycan/xylan/chitin deacetylase (PgdA/CDA1 family)
MEIEMITTIRPKRGIDRYRTDAAPWRRFSLQPTERFVVCAIHRTEVKLVLVCALVLAGTLGAFASPNPAAAAITLHVPVLVYHNVLPRDRWPPGATDQLSMYITPERVFAQLKYLRDHGWRSVTARSVAQYAKRGERMHSKAFVISVDDGRLNGYVYLWPILRELRFRATFYVVGSRIGRDKFASADQLREMDAAGSEIANHTYSHMTLTRGTRAEVIEQVRMGSDAIYEAVGRRPLTLAYPGGAYNTAVMDAVRSEGSTWMAFTIKYGCSESWSTRLHEQRIIMRHDYTPASVLAKVAPYAAG